MSRIPWQAVLLPGIAVGMVVGAQADTWAREDAVQAVLGIGLAAPLGFIGLEGLQRGGAWLARVAGIRPDEQASARRTAARVRSRDDSSKEQDRR